MSNWRGGKVPVFDWDDKGRRDRKWASEHRGAWPRRTPALEREWAAKLRASGFRDLEGRDRDGPLSDRGNLHVVTEGDGQQERLAERIETGSAYHTWAMGVLHGHHFSTPFERDAWASHADGVGILETSRKLGTNFHKVRNALQAVREAIALTAGNQGNQGNQCGKQNIRRLVRQSDPATLLKLAALLLHPA